jgi:hypothetical protein
MTANSDCKKTNRPQRAFTFKGRTYIRPEHAAQNAGINPTALMNLINLGMIPGAHHIPKVGWVLPKNTTITGRAPRPPTTREMATLRKELARAQGHHARSQTHLANGQFQQAATEASLTIWNAAQAITATHLCTRPTDPATLAQAVAHVMKIRQTPPPTQKDLHWKIQEIQRLLEIVSRTPTNPAKRGVTDIIDRNDTLLQQLLTIP